MYWQAGVENKPTLFLFTDTQVVEESFLEDINNMLSSGEVPTLYKTDEFEEVRQAIEQEARQDGARDSAQVSKSSPAIYTLKKINPTLRTLLTC